MTRLKFLAFALPTLALLAYLVFLSPGVAARSADQVAMGLTGVPAAVALRLESQRSDLQAAVIRLAASPAALNPGPKSVTGKIEAPTADRFAMVRNTLLDGLPGAHKTVIAIAITNEAGTLFSIGSGDAAAAPEGVDVPALAAAALPGGAGTVGTINGAPTLFYATPLLVSERNEVRALGTVLVGLPLVPDAKALSESVARDLKLEAVGLASNGVLLSAAGPQKALAEQTMKSVKANTSAALATSPVDALMMIKLPLMTAPMALETGLRRDLQGTPYEVVAVASARPSVEALAAFQFYAVAILMALALLAVAVLLMLGPEEVVGGMSVPPPMPVPPISRPPVEPLRSIASMTDLHQPAEASPDDFHFPPRNSSASPAPAAAFIPAATSREEPSDPFGPPAPSAPGTSYASGGGGQPLFTPPPGPAAGRQPIHPFDEPDEEGGRTVAYPMGMQPGGPPNPMDPFAMAAAQDGSMDHDSSSDDSTRVAAVPKELIQAARGGGDTGETPVMRVPAGAMPKVQAMGGQSDEERHFQEVFRDFIATRERCGEQADGLTFEKFKLKLLKNKDQLVAKYNCRSVRFQVYTKDGKAALKATPVKD